MSAKVLRADAAGAGHVWRTVQEAAKRLEVMRRKDGMEGGWTWSLPGSQKMHESPKVHEGATSESMHLRAPSAVVDSPEANGEVL